MRLSSGLHIHAHTNARANIHVSIRSLRKRAVLWAVWKLKRGENLTGKWITFCSGVSAQAKPVEDVQPGFEKRKHTDGRRGFGRVD